MSTTSPLLQTPRVFGQGVYPFADHASLRSVEGVAIPSHVFTDAMVYPAGAGPAQYLSLIKLSSGRVTITLASETEGELATGRADAGADRVVLRDARDRVCGLLLVNVDLLRTVAPAPAELVFDENAMPLAAACASPWPAGGVEGFLTTEEDTEIPLGGDVWLVGEDGVVFKYVGANVIDVHLIGDRLFARKACQDAVDEYQAPRPLKSLVINPDDPSPVVLTPDDFGDMALRPGGVSRPDNILRVETAQHGLILRALGNFD